MRIQENKMIFRSLKLINDTLNRNERPFFSILVRMKNEQKMLPFFLKSLRSQITSYSYELIFLDSGSTDSSIKLAEENVSNSILYRIEPNEFSFSKTCNFLVSESRAPYCILLSAHVEIIGCDFLQRLGDSIQNGFECGYFRQVVNHNNGYSLYDVLSLNKGFPEGNEVHTFNKNKFKKIRYSNAGSFFRTQLALETPFPDVIASEDYLWATKILEIGEQIHYVPTLMIAHSHNETLREITRRVKINKNALYGNKVVWKKMVVTFLGVFIMLFGIGCGLKKSFNFALAHAKGYLK